MISSDDTYKVTLIDGKLYDPWAPSGPPPEPGVIAHGLARLCRYGGQVTRDIYTVAEHSIWVALRVFWDGRHQANFAHAADVIANRQDGWRAAFLRADGSGSAPALYGLIHDSPEGCGLVDLPTPIGRHEEMIPYKQAHTRCMRWLAEGWGIGAVLRHEAEVDVVDKAIIGAERCIRTAGGLGLGAKEPWPDLDIADRHDLWRRYGPRGITNIWKGTFEQLVRQASVGGGLGT